jgi:hypothetical protein
MSTIVGASFYLALICLFALLCVHPMRSKTQMPRLVSAAFGLMCLSFGLGLFYLSYLNVAQINLSRLDSKQLQLEASSILSYLIILIQIVGGLIFLPPARFFLKIALRKKMSVVTLKMS